MANGNVLRITTGQMDWSRGVDSDKAPTIASAENPNGLKPNQLAWGNNLTVRGNGLSPRAGYKRLLEMPVTALWGEALMYKPSGGFPYIVCLIGGRVYRIRVDTDNSVEDLSATFGLTMPVNALPYMVQAEEFIIIQAGDYTTLPLFFWQNADGTYGMRRSLGPLQTFGIVSVAAVAPAVGGFVLLTLSAPFTGAAGQTIFINGKTYTAGGTGGNYITMKNMGGLNYPVGTVVPTGTFINFTPAQPQRTTTAPFVVPVVGADVTIAIDSAYTGSVGDDARVGTNVVNVWDVTVIGLPPAGANQVYVTNLTDTPGAAIAIGATLATAPELPAAGPMDYYMGRVWLASGREYIAGDIVGGPSGTAPFTYRDSILRMNENTYISLGGTFTVPDMAGNITALKHPIQLDTSLGEGQLFVFTDTRVYSVNVVPTRAAWQTLKEPIQRVAQIGYGAVSDRSVVGVNGDLFFQSIDPGVRSMTEAVRYFQQWGNLPISIEESRATILTDRALLKFGSGILFDNRVLQTTLPEQSDIGVIHKGLMPLNFDTISTLAEKLPPAWEGVWEGVDILRVLTGNFGGLERAFAFVRSSAGKLELWELTLGEKEDSNLTGGARITWALETPSFTWSKPFALKELDTVEIWVDRLSGPVDFILQFRPDQHPCWEYYFAWQICNPRNNCEDPGVLLPCPYPTQLYRQGYRATMVMPKPPTKCETSQARPINFGYSFQFRLFVHGYCRIRGFMVHAFERDKAPYEHIVCGDLQPGNEVIPMKVISDFRTTAV